MKNTQTIQGKLIIVQHAGTSRNGNPRYMVMINETVYYTQPDAKLGYSITNHEGKEVIAEVGYYYGKSTIFNCERA